MPSEVESLRASTVPLAVATNGNVGDSSDDNDSDQGDMEDEDDEEIPLDMEDVEAVSKKARQDEDVSTEHLQVLERLKANQRRDYMKGTVSGSVQATDRLMKELRDIYRSQTFKSGAYQVGQTDIPGVRLSCDCVRWSWSMILSTSGTSRSAGSTPTRPWPQTS